MLVRRGEACESDRRRWRMLLDASPVERFLEALGRDADAVPLEEPTDTPLLERVVSRLTAPTPRAPPSRQRWPAALAALTVIIAAGTAAAVALPAWWSTPKPSESGAPACTPGATPSTALPAAALSANPGRRTAAALRGEITTFATANAATAETRGSAASPSDEPPVPARTAAEQFAGANELRRTGRTEAAIAAYGQLQSRHPNAPEALVSYVVLGRILLQRGEATAAEAQFARYLRRAPAGSLAEDALFGRASALRMGGRTAEERRALTQLVTRYPGSVTGRAAQARLEELN